MTQGSMYSSRNRLIFSPHACTCTPGALIAENTPMLYLSFMEIISLKGFLTYLSLAYNVSKEMQSAFLRVWRMAWRTFLSGYIYRCIEPCEQNPAQLFLFEGIHFLFVRVWISSVQSICLESPEQVWFIQQTTINTPVFSIGGSVSSDLSAAI